MARDPNDILLHYDNKEDENAKRLLKFYSSKIEKNGGISNFHFQNENRQSRETSG